MTNLLKQFNTVHTSILEKVRRIKIMIFDIDGVFTDGGIFYTFKGELFKRFNILDGHGIKLLHKYGVKTAIITARQSSMVLKRAKDLNITYVFHHKYNKLIAFERLLLQTKFMITTIGYIGDDIVDLPILCRVGFSVSVANGHDAIKTRVDYITKAIGGQGAVREVCDLLLYAQGNYEAAISHYLNK